MLTALHILRATKLAEFGPTPRDRDIFFAAESGEPVQRIARRSGLSVRTVKNIVNTVRDRLARELAVWRRMTVERLLKKEERLRRLATAALTGWKKPVNRTVLTARGMEHTTTRPGRLEFRVFAAAERLGVTLEGLELYIEQRMAEEERTICTGDGAIRSAGLPPAELLTPAPGEVERHKASVVSWPARVRRRKSLSGRRLRVPRFVRAHSVRRSACDDFAVTRPRWTSKTWVYRIGIPPPAAGRGHHLFESGDAQGVEGSRSA